MKPSTPIIDSICSKLLSCFHGGLLDASDVALLIQGLLQMRQSHLIVEIEVKRGRKPTGKAKTNAKPPRKWRKIRAKTNSSQ